MNHYNSDELYTFDEYCEVLGIGANLGRHLLKTGQVKGFYLGRSWRIPKSSIEDMISEKLKAKNICEKDT